MFKQFKGDTCCINNVYHHHALVLIFDVSTLALYHHTCSNFREIEDLV